MNQWTNAKLCDVGNLILGGILFFSPWLFKLPAGAESQNALISGIVIVVLSLAALAAFAVWEEWLNLIVGLWLIVSPWVLKFQGTSAMRIDVATNRRRNRIHSGRAGSRRALDHVADSAATSLKPLIRGLTREWSYLQRNRSVECDVGDTSFRHRRPLSRIDGARGHFHLPRLRQSPGFDDGACYAIGTEFNP